MSFSVGTSVMISIAASASPACTRAALPASIIASASELNKGPGCEICQCGVATPCLVLLSASRSGCRWSPMLHTHPLHCPTAAKTRAAVSECVSDGGWLAGVSDSTTTIFLL